jgi:hypothetical protein
MPILNGVDLLLQIKHKKDVVSIPYCIALTAYSLKDDREKYIQIGFDEYIPKPIDFTILYNLIYNYCINL